MKLRLVDTHVHLDFSEFKGAVNNVVNRATEAGVDIIINVGADFKSSLSGIELGIKYPNIYSSVGMHPHVLVEENLWQEEKKMDNQLEQILKAAKDTKKVVAIGEIGLDYYKIPNIASENELKMAQKDLFIRQLDIAKELGLPVIIHSRDAAKDTLEIASHYNDLKIVFHCFSYDLETAKKILQKGFFISFTANITYPKNFKAAEVIGYMPIEQLMLETDAPFLAPQNKRGQVNEPANVIEVAKKISQIKGISVEEAAGRTTANAQQFFPYI